MTAIHILLSVPCNLPGCFKIGVDPVLLHVGPLALYWYGLLIAVGFVVAVRLMLRDAEREGMDPDQALSAVLVAALFALLGARLYYILSTRPGYYFDPKHLGEALSLSTAGLSFFGGIIGAGFGAWIYCARYKLPFLRLLDLAAIATPLGQAIGRIGNVINGDMAGTFTNGFGVEYTNPLNPFIPADHINKTAQPVAILEVVFDLLLFAVLWFGRRRFGGGLRAGQMAGAYLFSYSVGRLFLSALDTTSTVVLGLKATQLIALAGIAVGLWLVVSRHNRPEPVAAAA